MSHVHDGPLATYNSLTDDHLAGYFANTRMRRHLRKSGLVTKKGEIVTEATYRLNMSRKEHKKHVKDMLAQAIVHKTLDLERSRQSEIKKKLEEIAKLQLVRRVRDERSWLYQEALLPLLSPRSNRTRTPSPRHARQKKTSKSQSTASLPPKQNRASTNKQGDEAILPLLSPRPSRPSSSPSKGRVRRNKHRPYSAPRARPDSRLSEMSVEEEGDVLYLDDEGRPITPANVEQSTGEQNQIDTRHLHSLDTAALRKYAMLMAKMEEGRGLTSPYMLPQVPLPPRTPHSDRTPRSARRVQSASPQRPVTTDARIARLHRPETAKSHSGEQHTMCRVLMKYHGWALHLARETFDPTQEVVIEQQHCGGNTLTVFKERLVPGSKFEFISYRHRGYPFSLTLYVDGQMDSRVSTCCEYRHSRGAKIGGKQGHFSLLSVDGAIPCYKCQVSKGMLMRRGAPPKKSKRPAERHTEEVIVVSTKRDHNDEEQTEQRVEQPKHTEEEERAVIVAVEKDDVEDQKSTPKSKDASYDDDFDESQSSARSKSSRSSSSSSSSESGSETESSTRKDEGTPKKTGGSKEKFSLYEPRGEEREAGSPTPRDVITPSPRRKSPRVEVNGTGREIDDYSSDEDGYNKKDKVISMEGVEAEPKPVGRRRSGSSSSSSSSASSTTGDHTKSSSGRPAGDSVVINMDLLDKEEREQERSLQERRKRDEARQQEEEERLQQQRQERERQQEEKRQAEEVRRQELQFEQQRRQEEYRKKEEQRQQEMAREREKRKEEDERRRQEAASIASQEEDPETREENRIKAQRIREAQILEEQIQREAKRKEEERAREEKVREEKAAREEKRKREEEEKAERKKWMEDSMSSSRTESSTARSTTSGTATGSSDSEPSSAQSTPRNTAKSQHLQADDKDDEEDKRPASPVPPPAIYVKRHLEADDKDDKEDERAASPLPPPAIYEKRQRLEEPQSPPRPASPFPDEPAQYIKRPKRQRDEPVPPPALYEPRPKTAVGMRAPSPTSDEQQQDTARSSSHSETSQTYTEDSSSSSIEDNDDEVEQELDMTPMREQSKRSADYSDDETPSRTHDQESGTEDTSSESSSSDSDDNTADTSSASDDNTTDVTATAQDGSTGDNLEAPQHAETEHTSHGQPTSESDGENMHGGADPDNVAQQDSTRDLHPLRTQQRPVAKTHSGKVTELLTSPESVELSNVLLNKTQVYEVASHLEKEDSVKMVSLCNTGLDDDDIQRLTEAISASPSEPVMLNLSLNSLTEKSVKHVLHVLKAKPSIKILILQNNPVGDDGARQLVEGLQDLHIHARQARAALAAASNSDTASTGSNADLSSKYLLQELDLAETGLTDRGASHMAQLLANDVYVEALNLSHNPQVTADNGWNQIGSALAKNHCLKTLTLDGNKIGNKGVQHLARGLHNNRRLRELALEDAGIGAEGGKYVLELLKRNTTILELTLSPGNTIPENLQDDVLKYIALNRVPYNNFGL